MALARAQEVSTRPNRQPLRLIAVVTQFGQVPVSRHEIFVRRPDALSEESEFVQELGRILQTFSNEMGLAQKMEPRRLFEAREYRPAVIAAMTLLEATLRERLRKESWENVQRPMSLRQLLDRAAHAGIVMESREEILDWMKLRNDAVHTAKPVSRNAANAVVEGVERMLGIGQ